MAKKGTLFLAPTPIVEEGGAHAELIQTFANAYERADLIIVEDEKPARRRWRSWDLPREAIEDFILYNEHTREAEIKNIIAALKKGNDAYIQSDGGMPGFCDPGRDLVYACHEAGIPVRTLPFYNSLIPAVAMSGFTEGEFHFLGFPPRNKDERLQFFQKLAKTQVTQLFMDTPYRLERVVEELCEVNWSRGAKKQMVFIAMDIGRDEESHFWGSVSDLQKKSKQGVFGKREFVFVIQ